MSTKRFTIIILSLFVGLSAFAQTSHITFKGTPIEGELGSFARKMELMGFTGVYNFDNAIVMNGTFAGFTDCKLYIIATPTSRQVWKVAVTLPEQSSWSSVKSRYDNLKEKYTAKYGSPSDEFEFFTSPYKEGDGNELLAVKYERCIYTTFWEQENGTISLAIESDGNLNGWIKIAYEDKQGCQQSKREKDSRIDLDI